MEGRNTEPARTSLIRRVRDLENTQACNRRGKKRRNGANTHDDEATLPAVSSFWRQNIWEEHLSKLA